MTRSTVHPLYPTALLLTSLTAGAQASGALHFHSVSAASYSYRPIIISRVHRYHPLTPFSRQSSPNDTIPTSSRPSAFTRALSVRGGGGGGGGADAASSPIAALTFGQNLAGSAFSTFATIYGLACIVAPERTAHLFYGYDEDDSTNGDGVGRYLMRLMGSVTCGIGLTSAFAIGAEIKAGPGAIPSTATFDKSIGVGLVPRFLMLLQIVAAGVPSKLRMMTKDAVVALIQTALFLWSMFASGGGSSGPMIQPDTIITLEVAFHILLGPLLFFKPSILFQESAPPSKHEKFMTRMLASYQVMGALLVGALQHPAINALPAVGLAAMVWVASLVHFTFVRKDVEECGTSTPAHVAMMIVGVLVAVFGLQQYLYLQTN
mmetsp:Transcript_10205/g.22897  ORF Transcript_10205/g.22897 Transcript_10205/m.22897 type:complete len:376 (-) Transcript_10205:36-1163(-)